jgi:hypothetical protein
MIAREQLKSAEDETAITEITIEPDGRVYVFGTSQPVLEVLGRLDPLSPRVRLLLKRRATCDVEGKR